MQGKFVLFCGGFDNGAAAEFAADIGGVRPQCRICVFDTCAVCLVSGSFKEW